MGARAVDWARLESVCTVRYRGFESLPIRHAQSPRSAPSLSRTTVLELAERREIKIANIRKPGSVRGIRLVWMPSLREFLERATSTKVFVSPRRTAALARSKYYGSERVQW
jgi:hypothetical protein